MHWDPRKMLGGSQILLINSRTEGECVLLFVPILLADKTTLGANIGWENAIREAVPLCPLLFSPSPQENFRSLRHAMWSVVHQYPSLGWQGWKCRDFWSIPPLFIFYPLIVIERIEYSFCDLLFTRQMILWGNSLWDLLYILGTFQFSDSRWHIIVKILKRKTMKGVLER